MTKLPIAPALVFNLVREVRRAGASAPIVVGGARELASALRRELVRDGDDAAVRGVGHEGASALVYILAHDPTNADERALRDADAAGLPIVVLGPEPTANVPYVLATDVIPLVPGAGFPLDQLGALLGAKLDEAATPLAARLPVLRRSICEALIARVARQNAILGAAVFVPGADLPVLTVNQLRLVLRIAQAHGQQIDGERAAEVLAVVGGAMGWRAAARQLLSVVPVAGWAVKGAVAYTGTRALGEAALRYFEARAAASETPAPRHR